jgi:hypothetical protein
MGSASVRHLLVGAVIAWGVLMASPVVAAAKEPLRITKFTVEATRATRLENLHENAVIVNEPYVPAFTQAGGHPWALTTTIEFAQELSGAQRSRVPTQEPKDIVVSVPPGLLGDPMATPQCPLTDAFRLAKCPASTQVGFYALRAFDGHQLDGPIWNLTPERGQTAEFGLSIGFGITLALTGHLVRTHDVQGREGYGLTVASNGIPESWLYRSEITFWGVPADPSHDPMRGLHCATAYESSPLACEGGGEPSGVAPVPFLTWPTDCSAGPETATLRADSWEEPGRVNVNDRYEGFQEASLTLPGVTGCNTLAFEPSIEVRPDTLLADEPVGLNVNLKVPLSEKPGTDATPQLRNAVVTLPEGVSVSPGVVDGIQACNESGPEGINFSGPESERLGPSGELELAPGKCPDASAVGTAEAITPLLGQPVKGNVYLARPGCGNAALGQAPCTEQDALDGNLYKLYLELGGEGELAVTGVHIKVEGKTEANPATGQLTTVFEENPQQPFSELKIHLNGGPRAPLANPGVCGNAVTTADFTPWSAPGLTPEGLFMQGTPDATPSSFYEVVGCASTPPFKPGLISGTVTPNAGQFSAFTLNLSRQDREQYVKGIQIHTPPGLLGMLSSVQLCPATQANDPSVYGACPPSSKIGTTRVATGAGSHPFEIEGDVFLTGPYEGSPFGLSIVVHVITGPFNLGNVVVRARIAVDPNDSSLTVTTDETGPHAVPQIVFGVPARLKRITVNIDRPDFMFNPTNCKAQQITAVVSGSQNAVANVASPFAVGGCRSLAFKPQFKVSTGGHTSKANGASLDAKVTYPPFRPGSEANIAYVKVSLPKQLPSRLTTLQKACLAATFNANPAMCPSASIIGIARASTPLLPVELQGPVYFVSHGGEEFPSLIVVLQGDGVRVDLTGATFISKAGVTSSTFKTVPDVPVSSFELYLPEGRYSALGANSNLCSLTSSVAVKRKVTQRIHGRTVHRTITTHVKKPTSLSMPTEFVGQNGAVLNQSTKIEVTGCTKSAARTARAHRAKASGQRKRTTIGHRRTGK